MSELLHLLSPAAAVEDSNMRQNISSSETPAPEAPLLSERTRGAVGDEIQVVEEIMESCDEALTILNDLLMYEKMEDGGGFVLERREEPILFLVQNVSKS